MVCDGWLRVCRVFVVSVGGWLQAVVVLLRLLHNGLLWQRGLQEGLLVVGQRVLRVERPGRPFSPGLLLGHADRVYLLDDGRCVRVVLESRGLTCRGVLERLEEAVEDAVWVMGKYGFEVSVEVPEKPVGLPARMEKLVKKGRKREERVYATILLSPRIVFPPALIIYDYAGAGLYRLVSRGWAWGVDALRTEEVLGLLISELKRKTCMIKGVKMNEKFKYCF